MELQERLALMADLGMAAQRFRPAPARTIELIEQGLMWVHESKPPVHGMTEEGKLTFLRLLCEGSELDVGSLRRKGRRFNPTVSEFNAGAAFLDRLEAEARSGTRVFPNEAEAVFAAWLVHHLPGPPPPSDTPAPSSPDQTPQA
jgi:hypothetical protein